MYSNSMGVFQYTTQPYDNYVDLAQRFNTTVDAIYAANPNVNPHMLFSGQMINIPLQPTHMARPNNCISQAEVAFKSMTRLLWEQHITWTRMAVTSLVFNLPDVDFVLKRLLRNATDMGNALKPLYGEQLGNQYVELIKEHLVIAADLIKALLANNESEVASLNQKWHANADDIAAFLSRINPYLTFEPVKNMLYKHLELLTTQIVSMINKDYQADVDVFDTIQTQALEMADAISSAIVRQFPRVFQ